MDSLDNKLTVGVDIGGTFTDFVVLNRGSGKVFTWKSLTTPKDPSQGVIEGFEECMNYYNLPITGVQKIVHGTTLVTNAVIERKGAKTGLITTHGFRDTLEIGREIRYDLYDLHMKRPETLVPRQLRQEVQARGNINGNIDEPLDREELYSVTQDLIQQGVKSVAISFLHSYLDNSLEKEAEAMIKEWFPDLRVSISSDVASEIGEFERTSTVVVNAYVKPLMETYLNRLITGLKDLHFEGNFFIMLSSGGFCDTEIAKQYPVRLLESGPAAGALSAAHWGTKTGNDKIIGFDMGGTTAKACLIDDNEVEKVFKFEAGRVHRFKRGSGIPILIPTVELIEIGAGGGSLAHADSLGLLKVGPQSASSDPGPACYGLGGLEPTVTDADLTLGYLDPDFFLNGTMSLYKDDAEKALDRRLSQPLDLNFVTAAWGVHKIVNENMARAARVYTAEKGRDHRQYSLVATGGAGPVHAYGVARSLNLKEVIYPFAAGVSSALGMLVVPAREDLSQAFFSRIYQCDWETANQIFINMEKEALDRLNSAGVTGSNVNITRLADIQYVGQEYSVTVPLPNDSLEPGMEDQIVHLFEEKYLKLFQNTVQGGEPEIVNLRLVARSSERIPELTFQSQNKVEADEHRPIIKGYRPIYIPSLEGDKITEGHFQSAPVYDRYYLQPGDQFVGPCIIEEKESTIVINGSADVQVNDQFSVVAKVNHALDSHVLSTQMGGNHT